MDNFARAILAHFKILHSKPKNPARRPLDHDDVMTEKIVNISGLCGGESQDSGGLL